MVWLYARFLKSLGAELPQALTGGYNPENGTYIDLIAVLVVIFVTYIVSLEAKKALRLNNAMVYVKFGIIALFIIVGIFSLNLITGSHSCLLVFRCARWLQLLCFAFLGFDAVAMAAEEVKTRKKMCQEESLVRY